jgi:hypothetical protein
MLKSELKALLNSEARSPIADLKYLRVRQVPRRYPISRALLYQWLNDGKIKSVLIPGPGGIRGIRFILASSIEDFLERLANEQKDESFTPVVAREYNTGRRGRKKEVLAWARLTQGLPKKMGRPPSEKAATKEQLLAFQYGSCPISGKAEKARRLLLIRHVVGLWSGQERGGKLMRLALCPSAPRGEWQAAALAYFRGLRAAEVTAAQLREMFAPQAPVGFADPTPFLSFGRYRGQTVRWIAEHAPSYAEWLLRKAVNLSPALHGEFRRELRRRYGTAATPWPATPW